MERSTRQKTAIRAAIETAQRPLSPQEVLDAARAQVPALSIATVYRNLKQLLADGAIQPVPLPGDNPRYESKHAAHTHHHHFQCTRCERVFDVPGCPGDLDRFAPDGFTVERHELTFYGLCAECGVSAGRARTRSLASRSGKSAADGHRHASHAAHGADDGHGHRHE